MKAAKAASGQAAFTWTLAFTAILFLRPQDMIPPLAVLHLAELSAIFGLASLVLGHLQRRQPVTRWTPELIGVLVFGAIILLTAPFSIWTGGSIGVFTDLYAKVILVYLLAVNVLDSPERLDRLSWLLVLAVGYIGFVAVIDYVRGVNMVGHGTRVMGSVGGIMQNPNDLALNMVAFLPLAAFIAIRPGPPLRRLVAAGCATCMLGAIVASGSRGGFLGFALMMIVLAAFVVRQRPGLVIAGVLAMVCALPVLPASYWRRIESITDPSKDDFQSSDAREHLFGESWNAFVANPLTGVGAGEFKDWNPGATRRGLARKPQRLAAGRGAELGIFGLAAFVFLVVRACAGRRPDAAAAAPPRAAAAPPPSAPVNDARSHADSMCTFRGAWRPRSPDGSSARSSRRSRTTGRSTTCSCWRPRRARSCAQSIRTASARINSAKPSPLPESRVIGRAVRRALDRVRRADHALGRGPAPPDPRGRANAGELRHGRAGVRAMGADPRVAFSFTASDEPRRCTRSTARRRRRRGRSSTAAAALMRFDAYLTSDFTWHAGCPAARAASRCFTASAASTASTRRPSRSGRGIGSSS